MRRAYDSALISAVASSPPPGRWASGVPTAEASGLRRVSSLVTATSTGTRVMSVRWVMDRGAWALPRGGVDTDNVWHVGEAAVSRRT
jgi:hypothetical protein